MTPRHQRALRGAVGAAVATLVGGAAHTLAGGGAPSPGVIAAAAILAWPFAVALAGSRSSVWRTGATVALSQAFLHVAFVLTADADPTAASGHAHHGAVVLDPAAAVSHSALLPDAPMLVAHLLAALATVAALCWGERMLRALGRGIRTVLSRAADVVPPLRPALRRSATGAPTTPVGSVALFPLSRRGPPAPVIAAV